MGVTACLLRNCLQWPHKRDFLGRSDSEVGSSVIRQMLTAGNFFTINRVVCSLDCQLQLMFVGGEPWQSLIFPGCHR